MLRRPRLLIVALLGLSCWAPVAEAQPRGYSLHADAAGPGAPSGVTERDFLLLGERLWQCYARELTGSELPDWARERLRLRLRFDRGRVTGVRVSRRARVPAGVRSCIEALRVPVPHGSSRPTGTWVQTFSLLVERVIRGTASLRGVTVEGSAATATALRAQLPGLLPQLRMAYQRAMRDEPSIAGVVEARFEVSPEGRVSALRVLAPAETSRPLPALVRAALSRARFSSPDHAPARVRVTLAFTPG